MSRNTPFYSESILLAASIVPKVLICLLSIFLVPRLTSPVLSRQNSPLPDTIPVERATRALLDEFTRSSHGRGEMISILDSLQTRTVLDWFTGNYRSASKDDTLQYELGNQFFEETGDSTFLDLAGAGRLRLRTVDLHTKVPEEGVFIEASLFEPLQPVVETYVKYGLIKQEIITNLMITEFNQAAGRIDCPKYLSLLFESLTLARENGFSIWEAHVSIGIARLFTGISRFEIARQYYEKAQNVAREIQNPIIAYRAANGLARIELKIGDPSAAFQQYSDLIEQSMRRGEREQSFLYRHRGMARLKLKDPEGALEDFLVAKAWAERKGWLVPFQNASIGVARVHEDLGHLDEAREMYLDVLSQDESPCRNPSMWLASYRLGLMAEARGDSSSAVEFYLHSISCVEHSRKDLEITELKISFFEDKMAPYERLVGLLYDMRGEKNGETGVEETMALEYCERSRMRSFLDIVKGASPTRGNQERDEQNVRKQEILRESNRLRLILLAESLSEEERHRIRENLDGLKLDLLEAKISDEIAAGGTPGEGYVDPNLLDVVRENVLDEKTCIIEYFVGSESSYAWFITKNGLEMRKLTHLKSGYEPLKIFIDLLTQEREEYPVAIGRRLYRDLIGPFEDNLDGFESVIFVTDDVLNYLPFESLPVGSHGDGRQSHRFLIQDYSISYAPSLATLEHLSVGHRDRTPESGTLLAVGDPVGGDEAGVIDRFVRMLTGEPPQHEDVSLPELASEHFPRLKESGDEVRRIASFFPQGKCSLLLQGEANETAFKAQSHRRYQVIHFATHGIYDDQSPEFSGLVLSPSPEEDGFLIVDEIMHMNLNSSLVVLSGCKTGMGRYVRGEGIVGLSRAFLAAGASTALVSLWEIGDSSTADFMEEFYRIYRSGMNKGEALTQAKRNMIRQGRKYTVWAPFVLIGNP